MRQSALIRFALFGVAGIALLAIANNVFAQDLENAAPAATSAPMESAPHNESSAMPHETQHNSPHAAKSSAHPHHAGKKAAAQASRDAASVHKKKPHKKKHHKGKKKKM